LYCRRRTGERREEDESGDESGLRSEAPHERVAQHVFPRAAICESAPSAVAGEEPAIAAARAGEEPAAAAGEKPSVAGLAASASGLLGFWSHLSYFRPNSNVKRRHDSNLPSFDSRRRAACRRIEGGHIDFAAAGIEENLPARSGQLRQRGMTDRHAVGLTDKAHINRILANRGDVGVLIGALWPVIVTVNAPRARPSLPFGFGRSWAARSDVFRVVAGDTWSRISPAGFVFVCTFT